MMSPFRDVASGSKKIHLFVWLCALIIPTIFAATGEIQYRDTYEVSVFVFVFVLFWVYISRDVCVCCGCYGHEKICFTVATTVFTQTNWANAALLFIPNSVANLIGVITLVTAYHRLGGRKSDQMKTTWALKRCVFWSINFFFDSTHTIANFFKPQQFGLYCVVEMNRQIIAELTAIVIITGIVLIFPLHMVSFVCFFIVSIKESIQRDY